MLESFYLYKPDYVKDSTFAIPTYITDVEKTILVEIDNTYMILNKLEIELDFIDMSKYSYFSYQFGEYRLKYYQFKSNEIPQHIFSTEIQYKMSRLFHYEWFNHLKEEFDKKYFNEIGAKIMQERQKFEIQPSQKDIFNIFKTSFNSIKVVIIGADPYHNVNANGIAFDSDISPKPVSYTLIGKSLQKDYDSDNIFNLKYTLNQGVMYLNSALSVKVGIANSHFEMWKEFMIKVIDVFNKKSKKAIPFIFIGKSASNLSNYLDEKLHYKIITEHPVLAFKEKRDWNNNDCFKKVNEILYCNGIKPVIWI